MRNKLRTAALVMALLASGCAADQEADGPIRVVVTTTILGDVVSNVAGADADVEVLIPLGASPHDFLPSSRQVAAIYDADLVVANGLELEEGLGDVLATAQGDGINVLSIGPLLSPIALTDGNGVDPHVWMDPVRMEGATAAIAEALTLLDGSDIWQSNAKAYTVELQAAHEVIAGLFAAIPPDQRKLVTNHDSLGYLADRYALEVIGTVIPGGTSLGDPSSAALADLVRVIDVEQVSAIFAETSEPDALAAAIAAEAAADVVVVELYTGSLGEAGSRADTLLGMYRVNAERIAAALGS